MSDHFPWSPVSNNFPSRVSSPLSNDSNNNNNSTLLGSSHIVNTNPNNIDYELESIVSSLSALNTAYSVNTAPAIHFNSNINNLTSSVANPTLVNIPERTVTPISVVTAPNINYFSSTAETSNVLTNANNIFESLGKNIISSTKIIERTNSNNNTTPRKISNPYLSSSSSPNNNVSPHSNISNNNNNTTVTSNTINNNNLLFEFKNNKVKNLKLSDLLGNTVEFCKDQYGSRYIQQQLSLTTTTKDDKDLIFNDIKSDILNLSNDVFGNYVIQKFFDFDSPNYSNFLIENFFLTRIFYLSTQVYACRVIQKALESNNVLLSLKIKIINELSDKILFLIKDQNGNHVIQKAIETIPIENLPFILNSIKDKIFNLSIHSYGCRVIQRLLKFGSIDDQKLIINELTNHLSILIQDQYGNYVIQHILTISKNSPDFLISIKDKILNIISKNLLNFSKHKFASNVVEKAIINSNSQQQNLIIDQILPNFTIDQQSFIDSQPPIIIMLKDQFANYVIQKMLIVSTGERHKILVDCIRQYLNHLKRKGNSNGHNRHLASVEKLTALIENEKPSSTTNIIS